MNAIDVELLNPDLSVPCDIVLLPDDSQSVASLQCSQSLASQGSIFTLDNEHFYAHASLYMFQMSIDKQATCIDMLKELADKFNTLELVQNGYYYQDSGFGKGYVDINFFRNANVDHLQQKVVEAFTVLKAGMRQSDIDKMSDATGLKLENLKKYGYPAIGELFRPHITLTKFSPEVEPDLTVLPAPTMFTGKFTRIGLFEMSANGTCTRKIAEFKLSAQ